MRQHRILPLVLLFLLQDGAEAFTSSLLALRVHSRLRAPGLTTSNSRSGIWNRQAGLPSLSASAASTTTTAAAAAQEDARKISRADLLRGFVAFPMLSAIGSTAADASPPPLAGEEIRQLTKVSIFWLVCLRSFRPSV